MPIFDLVAIILSAACGLYLIVDITTDGINTIKKNRSAKNNNGLSITEKCIALLLWICMIVALGYISYKLYVLTQYTLIMIVGHILGIIRYIINTKKHKMTKITKMLKNKYIYVDIDGTLAEYRFNNHVSAKDGTSNGQTIKEIEEHIFLESRPLKSVIETLRKAKKKGIWICGAIISPIELVDKVKWLDKNCNGIDFNGLFWFVSDEYWESFLDYFKCSNNSYDIVTEYGIIIKGSKTQIWDWLINHNIHNTDKSHKLKDVVFIDDVLTYLKYAEEKGVTAYHISSLIK